MKLNSGQRLETPMGSEDENESQCSARGSRSEQQREGLKKRKGERCWGQNQTRLRTGGWPDLADMELHVALGLENISVFV